MSGMEEIKQTFFIECEDLLGEMESGLMLMESGDYDMETVNAVFRAVHSIKGGAGAFGLDNLVNFAHIFENVLDDVRSERTEANASVNALLLQCSDMLSDLIVAARDDSGFNETQYNKLLGELRVLSSKDSDEPEPEGALEEETFGFMPVMLDFGMESDDNSEPQGDVFDVVFKPQPSLFSNGSSATRLIRNLCDLGDATVICDSSSLPYFDTFDPEEAHLSWKIELRTSERQSALEEVFEFAQDDCTIEITRRHPDGQSEDDWTSADFTAQNDTELEAQTPDAPDLMGADISVTPPAPQDPLVVEAPAIIPVAVPAAKANVEAKKKTSPRATPPATIRINLERIDRLINQVGELVINQAMLTECIVDTGVAGDPSVQSGLDEFKQLTRDLQESVMAIRAQPVQPLFQRMSRIVREAADATQKSAKLVMEGEFTEVDKTIVEKLADPLTHMIRNAIDHGLESTEDRLTKGKSADGTVKLSAAHRSGKIVIEVSDDGAGINRERVKKIAIDKGLIAADVQLTDNEIDNLLFMAGFSTVEKVSTLSGRGVGMDVVKRAIQSIGGRISISSQPDKGSTFTISLPLTLAVLDGMLIQVANQTLVVPLTAIVETLLPIVKDIHQTGPKTRVVNVRGTFIPLIDLGQTLRFRSEATLPTKSVILSVEAEDGTACAILVDNIMDQRQVVIKSLEDNYGSVPSIAAATILGDGRIALILDIDDLIARSQTDQIISPLQQEVKAEAYA
ncbi:MAG: chemotaxis protein CheA [Maricaulaceae bacterium]